MQITSTLFWLTALVAPGLTQVDLGTAAPYGALAESGVTNTGPTVVNGDVGTTGAEIIGFPPGLATGTIETATNGVAQARADALTAYNTAQGLTGGIDSTANSELGGQTLQAGIYSYTSGVSLTGILTLDGAGNSAATWVFQISSTLITGSASAVVLINGASACNIYWAVGSSATLGSTSAFVGNILSSASISLTTGATVQGGLYAGAAVTLDDNIVSPGSCSPIATTSSSSISSTSTTSLSSTTSTLPITSTTTTSSTSVSPTSTITSTSETPTSTSTSQTSSLTSSPTSSPTSTSQSSSKTTSVKTTSTSVGGGYGYPTTSSTKKTTSTSVGGGYGYTTPTSIKTTLTTSKKTTSTSVGGGYGYTTVPTTKTTLTTSKKTTSTSVGGGYGYTTTSSTKKTTSTTSSKATVPTYGYGKRAVVEQ